MKQDEQPLLDLFGETPAPPPQARPVPPALSNLELHQAALGFLAAKRPSGLAADVPARFRKYKVAAAAFWANETGRVRRVLRTAIVEIHNRREHCFVECADHEALLGAIAGLRAEREALEAAIRRSEPHLADTDDLFSEFRTWHYERSADPAYRKLRRKLEKLQHALYQGSRLERIRRAAVADLLYLAVPAGTLAADEIAAGWGLLHVYPDGRVVEAAAPELQLCEADARNHLALNIGSAAAKSVLFAAGVAVNARGETAFFRPPRRRLKRTLGKRP